MTARLKQIARLLQGTCVLDSGDAVCLALASRLLVEALEFERHSDISKHESQIDFLLRGAVIRLTRLAVESGEVDLANHLLKWSEGVPREAWPQLTALLLTPSFESSLELNQK